MSPDRINVSGCRTKDSVNPFRIEQMPGYMDYLTAKQR